jgi:protein-S-isoprenylcysteine O-methyltransferase Ste14
MIFRKIIPPFYFLASMVLMVGLHHHLPIVQVIPEPVSYAGIILIITGFVMTSWGANAFRKAETPVKPFEPSTTLVLHGLYRYTRNPMYLGFIIILCGSGILLGSLLPFLVIPVFFLIIQEGFIKHEELFLENIFGDKFREYKSRVRRWL